MGAHRKPAEIRKIQGTDKINKSRYPDNPPEPVGGVGPAPDTLTPTQKKIWDEAVTIACPGVLGDADRITLEMLVKLIWKMRYGGKTDPDGNDVPDLSGTEGGHMIKMLGTFGMTPADRMRINLPGKKKDNPFGKFRK